MAAKCNGRSRWRQRGGVRHNRVASGEMARRWAAAPRGGAAMTHLAEKAPCYLLLPRCAAWLPPPAAASGALLALCRYAPIFCQTARLLVCLHACCGSIWARGAGSGAAETGDEWRVPLLLLAHFRFAHLRAATPELLPAVGSNQALYAAAS